MREIKFRGKTRNGKWVYGYAAKFAHGSVPVILEDTEDGIKPRKIIPDTVGQFTGLHDKNGKEIYEGDVVQQYWGFPHYRNGVRYDCYSRIGKVLFDKSGCFVLLSESLLYHLFGDGLTQEVIGNIHDNPELLKTE
jgi:uncharacterized phage protein (TIGR01671 family)